MRDQDNLHAKPLRATTPVRLPKLDRLLAGVGELQPVLTKTREIRALAGLVDGFLPPDLARQVRVANIREGELVLLAANSSVAAKLKLLGPSLGRYLLEQRLQVNSVSVRVQPNASRPGAAGGPAAARKSAHFSTHALTALQALYEGMQDSPARKALRELLEHAGLLKPSREGAPRGTAAGPAQSRKRRT
jgi:hypothetical protein